MLITCYVNNSMLTCNNICYTCLKTPGISMLITC